MGSKKASHNLGITLFGETRERVLALLFGHPDERFYQQRIIQSVGLGSGTVQRELQHLTRMGVLTRTVEGRQIYFQANRYCPIFAELHALVRKTFGVSQVLKQALATLGDRIRVAFIFGSLATGSETAQSDVDVFIVGDDITMTDVVSEMSTAQRALGREVNPSLYPTSEFCRRLAEGQHFISSVVAGPKLFLIGDDRELKGLAQIRLAQRAQDEQSGDRRPDRRRRS